LAESELKISKKGFTAVLNTWRAPKPDKLGRQLIASELKSAADTPTDAGDTATDTGPSEGLAQSVEVIEEFGGDDGARTRDLRRDRPAF